MKRESKHVSFVGRYRRCDESVSQECVFKEKKKKYCRTAGRTVAEPIQCTHS